MLRSLILLLYRVFKCFGAFVGKLFSSKSLPLKKSAVTVSGGDDWRSEDWEDFSIAVIPRDTELSSQKLPQCNDPGSAENDVFSDMQPVIKKAKKIYLQSHKEVGTKHNLDFAIQEGVTQDLGVPGELGNWNDGEEEGGWESTLHLDEGHLVEESKQAIKEKRRMERECRRKAQDAMRTQQRTSSVHGTISGLGIKTNS